MSLEALAPRVPELARHSPEHDVDTGKNGCETRPGNSADATPKDPSIQCDDLRNVGDRGLSKFRLARREQDVPRGSRPLELRRERHADNGSQSAAVERVALNNQNGSAKPRT